MQPLRVVVTGGSRGIGAGIVRVLARGGHQVGVLARSASDLQALAHECDVHYCVCDVSDSSSVQRAIDQLAHELGGIDALVNNAGRVLRKSIREIDETEWDQLLGVNVSGVFHCVRAVLPYFDAAHKGHIINISSISGRVPLSGGSAYAATKFAVTGFSESLFLELRDAGIKVTTIFPGSVSRDSQRGADDSWKVTPEQVGESCRHVLETAPQHLISALEVRPLRPPQ